MSDLKSRRSTVKPLVMIDRGNAAPAGGIGEYARSLGAALEEYQSDALSIIDSGVSASPTRFRPLGRLVYLRRLASLRSEGYGGADAVHFANIFVPKRLKGVAYVGTVHDLDPLFLPQAHSTRYRLYFDYAANSTVLRSDVVLTQSEAVRSEVLERYDIAPERIVVGGNGLSAGFIAIADREQRSNPEIPVMLFVGQVNRKKNVFWLVRTVSQGIRSGALPAMRLLLVGRPGFGSSEVEREVRSSGGDVEWILGCSTEELVRLMCSATMLVLPSLREGFGRTLLEAMYCGKPVVASRIPSSCEVAGEAGRYFELGSHDEFYAAVHDVLSGREYEERRRLGMARVAHYSWERLSAIYRDIYVNAVDMK